MEGADIDSGQQGDATGGVERIEHTGSRLLTIVVAMAAGALLFWLVLGRDSTPAPELDPATELADEPELEVTTTLPPTEPRPGYSLLGSASLPGRTVSFVRIPSSRGVTSDSEIFTLADGDFSIRDVGRELTSLGRLSTFYFHPGERRDYILTLRDGTVITTLGEAEFLPHDAEAPTIDLGEGFSALAGADDDSVWLLTSAERTARLVDLDTGSEITAVDLTENGRALDAVADGLVLSVLDDPVADFAYWSPEQGRQSIPGTKGAVYVGGAGNTVVFALAGDFLVFDVDDLEATPRFVPNPEPTIYRTLVSPDGGLLAASVVTSITEPNRIVVLDLSDGSEIHRVTNSIEVLFQWSSPTRLVYLRPDWPAVDLAERDVIAGVDANLVRLDDLTWWYSAFEQPERQAESE